MTCVTVQVCKGYTSEYNSGQTCYLLVRAQLAIEYRSICFAVKWMKRWLSVSSNFVPVWQCMPVVFVMLGDTSSNCYSYACEPAWITIIQISK